MFTIAFCGGSRRAQASVPVLNAALVRTRIFIDIPQCRICSLPRKRLQAREVMGQSLIKSFYAMIT